MSFKDSFTLIGRTGDYELGSAVAWSKQTKPRIFLRPGTKNAKLTCFSIFNVQCGKLLQRDPIKYL